MSEKQIAVNKTPIDLVFAIPRGAEESFVHTEDIVETGVIDIDVDDSGQETPADPDANPLVSDQVDADTVFVEEVVDQSMLATPTDFTIVSQTLRRAPGGQQVVDVLIDTEDINGALNYDIQVTKT